MSFFWLPCYLDYNSQTEKRNCIYKFVIKLVATGSQRLKLLYEKMAKNNFHLGLSVSQSIPVISSCKKRTKVARETIITIWS
jgi:hypothetical protein